jgi:hypothetical protein
VQIPLRRDVLDAALCDKYCQRFASGWWFSLGTPVSSTNKYDHHNITEILLNVSLSTITLIQVLTVCSLEPWEQFLLAISWRDHATFVSEMIAISVLI